MTSQDIADSPNTLRETPLVARPLYEQPLWETIESPSIKVLTGIRRCGKSSLLTMFKDALLARGVFPKNVFYLRLDSFDAPLEPNIAWLDELLRSVVDEADSSQPLYVLLDEIQEVKGWERPLRRLHESGRARIYITGSNAIMLSSDLASYLSGRYVEIPVYPLSFKEYRDFANAFGKLSDTLSEEQASRAPGGRSNGLPHRTLFDVYLRYGGMPGLFTASSFTEETVTRELSAIRDTVLLNDVAKRFGVRDIDLLEKLLRYVYSTSGNLFSANKVSGALTSMGRKTNPETVDNYLHALKHAFALYECEQVGLKGKTILQPQKKYFAPDMGLRNLACGFSAQNIGFQLEGVVYIELLRRGYTVSVGTLTTGEIDFIGQRNSERLYIQVCETLLDSATRARELAPLNAIEDSFPKFILTRDESAVGTTETGVKISLVSDWLL